MGIVTKVFLVAVVCPLSQASDFLSVNQLAQQDLDRALFDLHADHARSLEAELTPMFNALPKNEHGKLESSTVRFALHRYFVQKHGWFVKGLDPEGGSWDFTTTATMVKERATQYIQDSFATQLNGRGLGLKELSSFAAVVADLIHREGVDDLEKIYGVMELPLHGYVSLIDFETAIKGYLSQTVVGFGAKVAGRHDVKRMEERARSIYPEYDDIILWFTDMIKFRDFSEQSRRSPFAPSSFAERGIDFDEASTMMKMLAHHFGSVLKAECSTMKEDLSDMEIGNSGRVLLSDFYKNEDLPLHESIDYLRSLGVLEESDSFSTRLLIQNYISSKSRCLPFSGYYSVCCPDECEGLLQKLETEISTPTASPDRVIEVISRAIWPANISEPLKTRLNQVGNIHGGTVPIHGRLMMQWLHHVSPLVCPYPHASGTVKAVNQDEWLVQHAHLDDAMTTHEEKQELYRVSFGKYAGVDELPWSDVEELISKNLSPNTFQFRGCLRAFMGLLLVVSFLVPSCRALSSLSARKPSESKIQVQHFV